MGNRIIQYGNEYEEKVDLTGKDEEVFDLKIIREFTVEL